MKSKNKLILGILAGIGFTLSFLPQKTLAQFDPNPTGEARPADTFKNQDNTDPFSGGDNGSSMGVFDLIHRAQMGNIRDMSEYSGEQGQNIQSAAEKFRQMQLNRIRNQNQVAPNNQEKQSNTNPTQK